LSYGRMGCRPRVRAIRQPRHSIPRASISPIERGGSGAAPLRLGDGPRRDHDDGPEARLSRPRGRGGGRRALRAVGGSRPAGTTSRSPRRAGPSRCRARRGRRRATGSGRSTGRRRSVRPA